MTEKELLLIIGRSLIAMGKAITEYAKREPPKPGGNGSIRRVVANNDTTSYTGPLKHE